MGFNLKSTLKALLFSTAEPLSIKDVQEVINRYHHGPVEPSTARSSDWGTNLEGGLRDTARLLPEESDSVPSLLTAAQIREAMKSIMCDLEASDEVYRLQEGPNGYRLVTDPDYAEWVRLLRAEPKPQRLSPASMETLAIVGYRQPVTRAEIEAIRGVSSDSALNTLLEQELIHVTGRADLPGRPLQYETTEKFLEICGLSSLEELPASDVLSPNQITDWIRRASGEQIELSDADMGLPEEEEVLE